MKKFKKKYKYPTKKWDSVKQEIREILQELGISKRYFKQTLPRVTGTGENFHEIKPSKGKWGRQKGGKKPNLLQQRSMLRKLLVLDREMKEEMEQQKEIILEDQAEKSAMLSQDEDSPKKEELKDLVESVFDRNH